MAIEDGLFPLAYVTHTIKYLQQCKFSWSIKTLANNWQNYISSFLKLHGGERRWQSTIVWVDADIEILHAFVYIPSGRHVSGVTSTLLTALREWRKSIVAWWLKRKTKIRKRGRTSTLPYMAPLDVGTEFTITFLEDKFELNNMSSRSHISPKHTLCHQNVYLLKEA